jgi:hypothetical protein
MLTAEQWLTSTDPADMLRHVRQSRGAKFRCQHPAWFARYKKDQAPRKMRLFLLACCYRACQGSADPSCAELLKLAERFVETPPPLPRQENLLTPFYMKPGIPGAVYSALTNSIGLAAAELRRFAGQTARAAAGNRQVGVAAERAALENEAREQCRLLRDIFNPFRPVPLGEEKGRWEKQRRAWLRWNGEAVRGLAEAIYEEKAFDRLPILGDALEDAGCAEIDLLDHLRGPGPHTLGCWALDAILGRAP